MFHARQRYMGITVVTAAVTVAVAAKVSYLFILANRNIKVIKLAAE